MYYLLLCLQAAYLVLSTDLVITLYLVFTTYLLRIRATGVDLAKVLGGQTKILGGGKVVKSDKCMGVSELLVGTCPGCTPKSTPYD